MFEVSSPPFAYTHALKSSVPLINSHVDNRLFKVAPDFNQPLFQFGANSTTEESNSNYQSIKCTPLHDCFENDKLQHHLLLKEIFVILAVVAVYEVVHL